jgi:hypothetical protein
MVDVKIRKLAGKKAELRRMGHLTMEDCDGLQKKTKKIVVSATIWGSQASKLVR